MPSSLHSFICSSLHLFVPSSVHLFIPLFILAPLHPNPLSFISSTSFILLTSCLNSPAEKKTGFRGGQGTGHRVLTTYAPMSLCEKEVSVHLYTYASMHLCTYAPTHLCIYALM
jgi:hypothetical protein